MDVIITTYSDTPIIATKCSADTAGIEKAKQKSSLTLEVKLDILKRKEQGEGTSAVSLNLGLAQFSCIFMSVGLTFNVLEHISYY